MRFRNELQASRYVVGFRGGGWHRAGHRGNVGAFSGAREEATMARTDDALSVEDVLAASGGMQGLKDVLSTVVQDSLQSHSRPR